jgi:hypothetical protein
MHMPFKANSMRYIKSFSARRKPSTDEIKTARQYLAKLLIANTNKKTAPEGAVFVCGTKS